LVRREPSKSRRRTTAPPVAPAAAGASAAAPANAPAAAHAGAPSASHSAAPAATATRAPATSAETAPAESVSTENKGPDLNDALELIVETLEALAEERGGSEPIWGSMIKQAIKRRHPGFNERAYGFRSFNDLLADGEKRGLLALRADEKSGGYTVRVVDRASTRVS